MTAWTHPHPPPHPPADPMGDHATCRRTAGFGFESHSSGEMLNCSEVSWRMVRRLFPVAAGTGCIIPPPESQLRSSGRAEQLWESWETDNRSRRRAC